MRLASLTLIGSFLLGSCWFDPDAGEPSDASLKEVDAVLTACSVKIRNFDADGVGIYDDEPNVTRKLKCLADEKERRHIRFAVSGPIPAALRQR